MKKPQVEAPRPQMRLKWLVRGEDEEPDDEALPLDEEGADGQKKDGCAVM